MDVRPASTGAFRGVGAGLRNLFAAGGGAGWTTGRALAVVGAFAAVLFLVKLGSARSITGHEAHIVACAREMVATGDYLIPRIAGSPWLEKPPLPQWAAAASGAVWGRIDAYAARFPAVLAALTGLLVFTAMVCRLRGPAVGVAAGLVLASTYYTVTYARLAEPDVYLWVVVVAAMAVFARGHVGREGEPAGEPRPGWRSWSAFGFFVVLGLSQMSKGPMYGAALILAPAAAWLLLHRGRGWKWFVCPHGWVCAAAGLWWVAAVLRVHPEALDLWLSHTVGRLEAGSARNPEPVYYYLTSVPWQIMPWTLAVLPALPASLRRAWHEPRSADRFLWVWFGAMFVTLSCASGKHHHYIIHALPPFAVWTADALPWWRGRVSRWWGSAWFRRGVPAVALACVAAAAATTGRWAFGHRGPAPAWEVLAAGGGIVFVLVLAARECSRGATVRAAALTFALAGGVFTYLNVVWLDRADGYRKDDELFRRVNAGLPPGEPVVIFHTDPVRVVLELTRPVVVVEQSPAELRAAWARCPGCSVITTAEFEPVLRETLPGERVDQTPGPRWKGEPGTHFVVYRTAGR